MQRSITWLQELPQPLTQLVWDNAILLGPETARSLAVRNGEVVRATVEGRAVEAPVYVISEHAEKVATLPLGYGRRASGHAPAAQLPDAVRAKVDAAGKRER